MRIQIFCPSGSRSDGALTSAFRRWLSTVFGDILFPLSAGAGDCYGGERLCRSFALRFSSSPLMPRLISFFYEQTKDVLTASTSEALNTAQAFGAPWQVEGLVEERLQCARSLQGFCGPCVLSTPSALKNVKKNYLLFCWMRRTLNQDKYIHSAPLLLQKMLRNRKDDTILEE